MEQGEELIELLKSAEGFAGASKGELEDLIADLEVLEFAPGKELIKEGEPGQFVWVLISGELEVLIKGVGEINRISKAGEIFGEISAVSHSNATATVRSITNIETIAIPHLRMNQAIEKSPVLASAVLRSMAKYLGKR